MVNEVLERIYICEYITKVCFMLERLKLRTLQHDTSTRYTQ